MAPARHRPLNRGFVHNLGELLNAHAPTKKYEPRTTSEPNRLVWKQGEIIVPLPTPILPPKHRIMAGLGFVVVTGIPMRLPVEAVEHAGA